MRLLIMIVGITFLPRPSAAAVLNADETVISDRLARRVLETLDGIFGPGRAKVLVEVRGERLQVQSEAEFVSPLDKEPAPPLARIEDQSTSAEARRIMSRLFGSRICFSTCWLQATCRS